MHNRTEEIISRLETALEKQSNTEGERAATPTVTYCLKCDEITVDDLRPRRCADHPTVMSIGYEHGGIQAALTVLRYLQSGTDHNGGDGDE